MKIAVGWISFSLAVMFCLASEAGAGGYGCSGLHDHLTAFPHPCPQGSHSIWVDDSKPASPSGGAGSANQGAGNKNSLPLTEQLAKTPGVSADAVAGMAVLEAITKTVKENQAKEEAEEQERARQKKLQESGSSGDKEWDKQYYKRLGKQWTDRMDYISKNAPKPDKKYYEQLGKTWTDQMNYISGKAKGEFPEKPTKSDFDKLFESGKGSSNADELFASPGASKSDFGRDFGEATGGGGRLSDAAVDDLRDRLLYGDSQDSAGKGADVDWEDVAARAKEYENQRLNPKFMTERTTPMTKEELKASCAQRNWEWSKDLLGYDEKVMREECLGLK